MCSPAMASLGVQSFGVGMSTVGSIFAASAQKSALRSQARIAEINASIMDSNARNTIRVGTIEESRVKLATAQAKSQQRTHLASSGVDIANSNTALARLTGTDVIGEVDAQTVRANALRAAWGQRIEAGNLRRGAVSARASAASISPALAGFTSLLNGAGQVAASWYSLNKEGAFDPKSGTAGTATVGAGDDEGWLDWPSPYPDQRPGGRKPRWGEVGHEPWQVTPEVRW